MSPRKKSKHRGVLGIVLNDPWRKLISLVLACAMWVYLDGLVSKRFNEELSLELRQESDPTASSGDNNGVFYLALPPEDYSATDFYDAVTNKKISSVRIEGSDETRKVDDLLKNLEFHYEPDDEALNAAFSNEGWLEIDKRHLRPRRNARDFETLLKNITMTPAKVRVKVVRKVSDTITMAFSQIDLRYSDPGIRERIEALRRQATFTPVAVKVSCPEQALRLLDSEKLLFEGLIPLRRDTQEKSVQITLDLRPRLKQAGVMLLTEPKVEYKVRPNWTKITFHKVPVRLVTDYLDEDPRKDDFEIAPKRIDTLVLEVTGDLENELQRKEPQALQEWRKRHLRLSAEITSDHVDLNKGENLTTKVDIHFRHETQTYSQGHDFRLQQSYTVDIKRVREQGKQ